MKRVIIDTNCLLSFVTDRNPGQQKKIARLLEQASKLKKILHCHHHVLSEFISVLRSVYGLSDKKIHAMITDFISMPGIEIVTDVHMNTLLSYWPKHISDYGDAVIAAQCKHTPRAAIVTFDKKFQKSLTTLGLPLLGDF